MGSVHHLGKFTPYLSHICNPLRPLLKKNTNLFEMISTKNLLISKRKLQKQQKTNILTQIWKY